MSCEYLRYYPSITPDPTPSGDRVLAFMQLVSVKPGTRAAELIRARAMQV